MSSSSCDSPAAAAGIVQDVSADLFAFILIVCIENIPPVIPVRKKSQKRYEVRTSQLPFLGVAMFVRPIGSNPQNK